MRKLVMTVLLAVATNSWAGIDQDLIEAAILGDATRVAALLDLGASPSALSRSGDTPLMEAIYHKRHDVVELLLKRGISPSHPNTTGATPMRFAIKYGDQRMIDLLKRSGATESPERATTETADKLVYLKDQEAIKRALYEMELQERRRKELTLGQGWVPIGQSTDATMYIHVASKKQMKGLTKAWFLTSFATPQTAQTRQYQSSKELIYVKCGTDEYGMAQMIKYSNDFGTGTVVDSFTFEAANVEFLSYPPGSIGQMRIESVCSNEARGRKRKEQDEYIRM